MDKDLVLFLMKRLGILYYIVVVLAWIFGPLSTAWMIILIVLGMFIGGTFWQIANGSYKRGGKKASAPQSPPPSNWQPGQQQWPPVQPTPPQADPYRSEPGAGQ